jgi:ribosomal protein S18 acetylase RimI-like enzyme
MSIRYESLKPEHYMAIIALGELVHGKNYLNLDEMQSIYKNSWSNQINASWVAIETSAAVDEVDSQRQVSSGFLIGFRLTLAANSWHIDQWCSPESWQIEQQQVCYFKSNTIDEKRRGEGIGKTLLYKSIESAKAQGANAGLAHIWLASPNNSAFGYFTACGGKLIKKHPNRWQAMSVEDDYDCPVCAAVCYCTGAEMLLMFNELA